MPNDPYNSDPRRDEDSPSPRLSDGREHLGGTFERPQEADSRTLGQDFGERNAIDGPRLGRDFADPAYADEHTLGSSFADPNSADDTKLGNSFAQTNSSAKKHHRPVAETVEAPFKRVRGNKTLFWLIACVLVVMLIGLVIGVLPRLSRNREAKQQTREQTAEPEIDVVKVARATGGGGLVVPGTTIPITVSSVYARANGYLRKRFVDIGDHVHKGQLLAIIDAPDLDQQVAQARQQVDQAAAQLAQQQTQLALTKVTVERYRALVARGVFSRQDGDQREADYQSQIANVAAAERNVEAYKANLGHAVALQQFERVTAPFDGVVIQRNVDNGDLIQASGAGGSSAPAPVATGSSASGSAQNASSNTGGSSGTGTNLATPSTGQGGQGGALFTIAQSGRLRILVSVPEGYASQIHNGQAAALNFQELPNQTFHAAVTRTAESLDQNTRTELVEVQVDNHAGLLIPGMYAVVTFADKTGDAADVGGPIVVTGDAIAIRDDRPTVAVIDNGKIKLTPIQIGRDYGSAVEIVAGLRPGQIVASSFTDDVVEGASVRTHMSSQQQKTSSPNQAIQPKPPGGSTQYADDGIIDQDMQGMNAKPQQKKPSGGQQTKASGKQGTQQ